MNDVAQLIAQARAAHAKAMRQSGIAEDGAWVAREGWHEPPGSQYWHVTAQRRPTKAGVGTFDVSKAMTRDPAVAALLTFVSTALPQLCDLIETAESNLAKAEARIAELTQEGEAKTLIANVLSEKLERRTLDLEAGLSHTNDAEERVKEAVGVLEPFADAWEGCCDGSEADDWHTWESPLAMAVEYGHFRKAASLYTKLKAAPLQGDINGD